MLFLSLLIGCFSTEPAPRPEVAAEADPAEVADPAASREEAADPAASEDEIEVFATDAAGAPLLGRRSAGEDGCQWTVHAREGGDWGEPVAVPGYPRGAASSSGAVAIWAPCNAEQVDHVWVAGSLEGIASANAPADVGAHLPELVEAAWWPSPKELVVVGREPGDAIAGAWAFTLGEDGVQPGAAVCQDLGGGEGGAVQRNGSAATVLLADDLDEDGVEELVLEEPESCGTARCDVSVWTRCPAEGSWRNIGTLDHMDGVTALLSSHLGWVGLESRHAEGADQWRWNGHAYVSE